MSTLSQKAYLVLHDRIVTGRIGPGAIVSEADLARDLGMSRTPIGEAILKLANEGLVEQVPRYGTVVRTIQRRDVIEMFEMREALESYAAARAAELITAKDLAKLDILCHAIERIAAEARAAGAEALEGEQLQAFLSADMAFHMLILQTTGNSRILRSVTETRAVSSIFRMRRQRHDLDVVHMAITQHSGILAALRSGDAAMAHKLMSEHIAASKAQTIAELDAHLHEPMGPLPDGLPASVLKELEEIERNGPA